MKGKVTCCGCGAQFSTRSWVDDGVMGMTVNGGRKHYACKPCRDAGFDLMKHACMLAGLCHAPKTEKGVAA